MTKRLFLRKTFLLLHHIRKKTTVFLFLDKLQSFFIIVLETNHKRLYSHTPPYLEKNKK